MGSMAAPKAAKITIVMTKPIKTLPLEPEAQEGPVQTPGSQAVLTGLRKRNPMSLIVIETMVKFSRGCCNTARIAIVAWGYGGVEADSAAIRIGPVQGQGDFNISQQNNVVGPSHPGDFIAAAVILDITQRKTGNVINKDVTCGSIRQVGSGAKFYRLVYSVRYLAIRANSGRPMNRHSHWWGRYR